MSENLNEIEVRVLGSLVEKQLTTPEYYPLTMNALTAACNQKSNRDPIVSYGDTEILAAVDSLREKNLVYLYYGSTSRAVKYKHMLPGVYHIEPPEVAVIAVLMLRGPQTLGEIRERTGRLFEFSGIGEVNETLDGLIGRDEPLIVKLERQPGQKEARYAHLLSGEVIADTVVHREKPSSAAVLSDVRYEELQSEIAEIRNELSAFKEMFEEFRKQFD
ncbi:MAG: YceH family protein [Acidobacteriota bacterium]